MAADRFSAPLYELFASLGLDASQLSEGIENSEVDLRKFKGVVDDMMSQISASFHKADPAIEGVSKALSLLEEEGLSGSVAINTLSESIDKLVAKQERAQQQSERMAAAYAEHRAVVAELREEEDREADAASQRDWERLSAIESRNAAEVAAALKRDKELQASRESMLEEEDEEASRIDAERLAAIEARVAAEEAAAEAEIAAYHTKLDEYEAINEEMTRADIERLAAQQAASSSGGGYASAGLRVGASGIYPSLRLGMSGLGEAIAPVFPVLIAGAFVDILWNEVKAIASLTDEWTGFGKEAEKAWEKAFQGAEKTRTEIPKVLAEWDKANATARKGRPLTRAEERAGDLARLSNIGFQERGARAELTEENRQINSRKGLEGLGGGMGTALKFLDWANAENRGRSIAEMERDRDITEKSIHDLAVERGAIERRILEDVNKKSEKEKKMHDVVHEYAERLPTARTINPAAYMLQTLGFGPQPVQAVRASDIITTPPTSQLSTRSYPGSAGAYAPQTTRGVGSTSVGGINLTFNINYKFDGIPADVQDFMRNKAEPRLIEDIKLNKGGIKAQLIETLKQSGVRVG